MKHTVKVALIEPSVQTFHTSNKKTSNEDFQKELQSYSKLEGPLEQSKKMIHSHAEKDDGKAIKDGNSEDLLGAVGLQMSPLDSKLTELYPEIQKDLLELLNGLKTETNTEIQIENHDFISVATSILQVLNDINIDEMNSKLAKNVMPLLEIGKELTTLLTNIKLDVLERTKIEEFQLEMDEFLTRLQLSDNKMKHQNNNELNSLWKEQENHNLYKQPLSQILPRRSVIVQDQTNANMRVESINNTIVSLNLETILVQQNGKIDEQTTMRSFVREFSNILAKSNFSQGPFSSKLLIRLYPEQLGSMRVELLQRDGMMMARILTTTKNAKEMLDSQIHHLRQAFAQQNIAIDKIEINLSQQEQLNYLNQERHNEQQHHQENQDSMVEESKESRNSFIETLHSLLFETEV
ncbi:flagellar hook-length control protein FliK [Lederbergia graminis]|uniref:Flagellar hook-length control protein FliK n=1 Tax=Lederbergia graminis TaxID=735518 RepID=A0ABW0LGS7_9BACI